MRRALLAALLLLASCGRDEGPPPPPLTVCIGSPPSAYTLRAMQRAAEQWGGLVDLVPGVTDCDVATVWLPAQELIYTGDGMGLAGMRAGAIIVASRAWEGGPLSPLDRVLIHELGHALCLRHAKSGVMAPFIGDVPPFVSRRELRAAGRMRRVGCVGPHPEDRDSG